MNSYSPSSMPYREIERAGYAAALGTSAELQDRATGEPVRGC